MLQIISDVLDSAKIESGKLVLDMQVFNIVRHFPFCNL